MDVTVKIYLKLLAKQFIRFWAYNITNDLSTQAWNIPDVYRNIVQENVFFLWSLNFWTEKQTFWL